MAYVDLLPGERRCPLVETGRACMRHIMDIDIYHEADQDKSAYSGGCSWHTAHYQDAATSGHRSTPGK
ncbi:MAG: hypothetical protein R3C56_03630 [Pirellulaceae bacterium]